MIQLILIGALTAKPYAFSIRSWELEKIAYIDFFDSFGIEIYIEFLGLNIKRILPKINHYLPFNLITDRIRFFYDMLVNQKINNCYIYTFTKYRLYTWYGIYLYLKMLKIFNYISINYTFNTFNIYYYLSNNVDLYTLFFLKNYFLIFNLFTLNIHSMFNVRYIDVDNINFFFIKAEELIIKDFNLYLNIIIIGYNIRCEHPLLYIKLFNKIKKKKLKCFIFGIPFLLYLTNFIYFIGLTLKNFIYFFFNFINYKKSTLVLIGSSFLNRIDSYYYFIFFKNILNIVVNYFIKFDFYFIYFPLHDINLIFLGSKVDFRNNIINFFENDELLFLNSFNFFFFENECYIQNILMDDTLVKLYNNVFRSEFLNLFIFLGSYLFLESQQYNLIVPISFYFERENFIINIFGFFYKTKFIFAPKILVKDCLYFLNIFKNIYNKYTFSFSFKYNKFILKYFNFILNYFKFEKFYLNNINIMFTLLSNNNKLYFNKNILKLYNIEYLYIINNFYIVNLYAKLSKNLILTYLNNLKINIYNIL